VGIKSEWNIIIIIRRLNYESFKLHLKTNSANLHHQMGSESDAEHLPEDPTLLPVLPGENWRELNLQGVY